MPEVLVVNSDVLSTPNSMASLGTELLMVCVWSDDVTFIYARGYDGMSKVSSQLSAKRSLNKISVYLSVGFCVFYKF